MRGLNKTKGKTVVNSKVATIQDDAVASRTRLRKKRSHDEIAEPDAQTLHKTNNEHTVKRVQFKSPVQSDIEDDAIEEVSPNTVHKEVQTNEDMDIDSEGDDDYNPSDAEETYNYFKPSRSSMDKELDNLAKSEADYESQLFAKFLEEDADPSEAELSDSSSTSGITDKVNELPIQEMVHTSSENSELEEEDTGGRANEHNEDDEVIEPSLASLQEQMLSQNDGTESHYSATTDQFHAKPLRKKRVSKYDEPDQDAAYDHMFEHNVEVTLPLTRMLGLYPAFRKRLHEATRTQLKEREGPVNKPAYYDVNMAKVLHCSDPKLVQDHISISGTSGNRVLKLIVDSGSQVNLINENTLKGLKMKKFKLNEVIYVQGLHKDPKRVTHAVDMNIQIKGINLNLTMFIDNHIPSGEIILGLPFQHQHKFWIGYNEYDEQIVSLKHHNRQYKFKLEDIRSRDPVVLKLFPGSTKVDDKLSKDLIKCVESAAVPKYLKNYFLVEALRHEDVFYQEGGSTGRLNPDVHPPVKIRLKNHNPWRTKTIPLGPRREAAVKILSEMIDNHQLEYSDASYRNPWFLIPKKDGSHRMLIDLRELNKNVELEGGHPYSTEDLTSELAGRSYNTIIDVKNAYFQVPLDSETNDATSFLTPLGLLKYAVLPQGYINSVSEFSNILQKILKPVAEDVISFIDDIAIKGPLVEDLKKDPTLHKQHVDKVIRVLVLLKDAGLKINPVKLKFAATDCDFLGYHISPRGKTLIKGQIDALLNYPLPLTKKKLESFLGLVNYYRSLIPAFAELTSPLYKLATEAKAENKFKINWTHSTKTLFAAIIRALTSAPVLTPIDFTQTISLHCDASESTWAGVLQITDDKGVSKLVQCFSGKFHNSQQRYTIYEKELLSIYNTLMAVHPSIIGYPGIVHIYCDNKAITQVLNSPLTNSHYVSRLYKWLNFIRTFNYQIHHVAGKENVIADALTRCHSDSATPKISYAVNELITEFKQKLPVKSYKSQVSVSDSPTYKNFRLDAIKEYHRTLKVPPEYLDKRKLFIYRAHEFYSDEGILYKIGKDGSHAKRVITEPYILDYLFKLVHDQRGHPKFPTMFQYFSSKYYIPNLYLKLKSYLRSCVTCQKFTPSNERLPLHLHLPVGILHTVVIDTIFIRNKYLVVARDEFSGWVEARATTKLSGEFVARFLYEDWLCRFGHFRFLKSDNGSEFLNGNVKQLLKKFGIKHITSIPLNPQGNGMLERGHQPLIQFIKSLPNPNDWEHHLTTMLWVDRTTVKSRTGYTPQFLMFGFEGIGNADILQSNLWANKTYSPLQLMKKRFQQLQQRDFEINIASRTQKFQKEKNKIAHDKRYAASEVLHVGDMVLTTNVNIKSKGIDQDKITPLWSGPYRIVSIKEQCYKLESLDKIPLLGTYTRGMLKKFHQRK